MKVQSRARRYRLAAAITAVAMGAGVSAGRLWRRTKKPSASIWDREKLTGDWGGARTALKEKNGIDISLNYIGETFSVLSGGVNRASSYEGRLEFSVDADLQKLVGWTGATAHVTVFNIHSSGEQRRCQCRIDCRSQQYRCDSDDAAVHRLAASRASAIAFRSAPANWPPTTNSSPAKPPAACSTAPSAGPAYLAGNMTNGGPAYPLATPGVRVKAKATDNLSVLAAVFAGDPAGKPCGLSAQECNETGTTFSTTGGALWMGELQYAINQGKNAVGLPGVYKLGAWYATADFADQRYGVNGAGATVLLSDATCGRTAQS